MFYLLALLLFAVLYYVFVKLLSSIFKGCTAALLIVLLVLVVAAFLRSATEPVYLMDIYKIDNFEVTSLK